jgi:protein phosphatase
MLNVSLTFANKKIYDLEKTDEKYKGMGTTLVLLLKVKSNLYYMSIGDSRIYYLSSDFSKLEQVTIDDTYVNELLRTNVITKEEALNHPQKHVLTKAVGILKNISTEVKILEKEKGYILLCSDGATNMLKEEDILNIFSKSSFEKLAEDIITKANSNGGVDNITVIIVEL